MYQLDVAITQAINSLAGHSAAIDFLMISISAIGVPILVALVACQWWRRDNRSQVRHTLAASGLTFLLGLSINQLVLLLVHRVRPYDVGVSHLLVAKSTDPSFPSDHATASVAIAAAFFLHRRPRAALWFAAGAILVAFSRVYIGIHYAGDVVGGAATAFIAALLVLASYQEGTQLDRAITSVF